MALRDRLVEERPAAVLALRPEAAEAAAELLDATLALLAGRPGYRCRDAGVDRPDGVHVALDRARPMATLARLVQEDLCLLLPGPAGHVLAAAALCFPAGWTLAEKIGRPLGRIHAPVRPYDAEVERRVQRLFDAIRPGRPLGRANAHRYADPALHQPRREADPRPYALDGAYLRSEWQVLFRLPRTGAMVFSIHTYVLALNEMSPAERAGLESVR